MSLFRLVKTFIVLLIIVISFNCEPQYEVAIYANDNKDTLYVVECHDNWDPVYKVSDEYKTYAEAKAKKDAILFARREAKKREFKRVN